MVRPRSCLVHMRLVCLPIVGNEDMIDAKIESFLIIRQAQSVTRLTECTFQPGRQAMARIGYGRVIQITADNHSPSPLFFEIVQNLINLRSTQTTRPGHLPNQFSGITFRMPILRIFNDFLIFHLILWCQLIRLQMVIHQQYSILTV